MRIRVHVLVVWRAEMSAPASTQDWSSQLEAGISGRRIINIHKYTQTTFWVQADSFSRLKVSLSSLSSSALFLSGS